MRFDVLTLFPGLFVGPLEEGILGRARERGLVSVHLHNIRDYATDRHHTTDDTPYGGGGGMVMKPEPLFTSVEAVLGRDAGVPVVLLSPQGRPFSQAVAAALARCRRLLLVCGRYEGVDERVREHLVTDEISIGDYVLSGGELAALVVIDTVARREYWGTPEPSSRTPMRGACWSTRTTRGRRCFATGRFLRSSGQATTRRLSVGAASRPCVAPGSVARTCWRERG